MNNKYLEREEGAGAHIVMSCSHYSAAACGWLLLQCLLWTQTSSTLQSKLLASDGVSNYHCFLLL